MKTPESIINASRKMRKNMTQAEVFFWKKVKNNTIHTKVLRQKPIFVYTEDSGLNRFIIADFYLPQHKIIIEIDGDIHQDSDIVVLDQHKQDLLQQRGFQVLRFSNNDVLHDLSSVLNHIQDHISSLQVKGSTRRGMGGYKEEVQEFIDTPSKKPKMVVIYGPTGSGKTEMSIDIAKQLDTEIISTDSRQIFKYMDIGTGKITQQETKGVPHHMLDIITPDQEYSVGEFKREAETVIEKLYNQKADLPFRGREVPVGGWDGSYKIPILAGGTALYIDSIIYDFAINEGARDDNLRAELENLLAEKGPDALYKMLEEIDPEYAPEIHPHNARYVMRAIEVKKLTGKSKGDLRGNRESDYDILFLTPYTGDREALYNRINLRVEKMVKGGLVDEVKGLLAKGYNKESFGMKSIGYEEILSYLDGDISLEQAISDIQQNSRRYAKRQLTRFRKYS